MNNSDPLRSGRVQVSVPAVQAGTSSWASVCLAPGRTEGFKIGQSVWVMFEGGDRNSPVVMGVRP